MSKATATRRLVRKHRSQRSGAALDPLHPFSMERLEDRKLLSLTLAPPAININVSQLPGNQAEGNVVIDTSNPSHLFAISNNATSYGMMAAVSEDGGATWDRRYMASGYDGLKLALGDPSASFDTHGNLFVTYIGSTGRSVEVAVSADGGKNFVPMATFTGQLDQPTITAGDSSVWVTFNSGKKVFADGAPISSSGVIGKFQKPQSVSDRGGAFLCDVTIGANGEVSIAYESPGGGPGPSMVSVQTDPDGLGPAKFSAPVLVASSGVGGIDFITPQASRGVDVEVGVVYDRSGGAYNGRLYLIYTDEVPDESNNTDVMICYSDTQGRLWSTPQRVNDDGGVNAQFLPRIALDQMTGNVAFCWYDARNDLGVQGAGSTNAIANDDVQYFGAVGAPTASGIEISANVQISLGTSNGAASGNPIELGDYTGLAFHDGVAFSFWADNSNSTGDNSDGALAALDMYTARLLVQSSSPAAPSIYLQGGAIARTLPTTTAVAPARASASDTTARKAPRMESIAEQILV